MKDFAAYVFFVNREDLLQRAIDAFPQWHEELTIVDNSVNGLSAPSPHKIFRPPVPLTYTQTMNWMLKDATNRGVDFIAHFHSDAFSTNLLAAQELLDRARLMRSEERKWACLWSYYDIAWIINPQAVHAVGGWDTVFPAYFSDNDMRRRLELNGWECIDTNIQGVNHEGSATINSDPALQFLNGVTFPMYRGYYVAKHGGEPGNERFRTPFGK